MLKLYTKSYLMFIRNLNLTEFCILTRNPIHNSQWIKKTLEKEKF